MYKYAHKNLFIYCANFSNAFLIVDAIKTVYKIL